MVRMKAAHSLASAGLRVHSYQPCLVCCNATDLPTKSSLYGKVRMHNPTVVQTKKANFGKSKNPGLCSAEVNSGVGQLHRPEDTPRAGR